MKKYLTLLKYEFKNIVRDKMTLAQLCFPFIMLFITAVILPALFNNFTNLDMLKSAIVLVLVLVTDLGAFFGGILLAFLLLDQKDEQIFNSISVTSVSTKGYVILKLIYTYVLTVVSSLILIWGTKIFAGAEYVAISEGIIIDPFESLTFVQVFFFALSISLCAPVIGLFIGGLAKNKIEGFAYLKFMGFIIVLPALLLMKVFSGRLQYVLSVVPSFWASKALVSAVYTVSVYDLPFWAYILIGAIYSAGLTIVLFKRFLKTAN